jgi:hypothetical protein
MTTNELAQVINAVVQNQPHESVGTDRLIALIASLAAVALTVIAGYALRDSRASATSARQSADAAQKSADAAQRTNDLLARQLDLATTEHSRKIQRELADSRSSLIWYGGSSRAGIFLEYSKEFKNVGSEIKDVEIESESSDVSVIANPLVFLPPNASSVITFKSKSSQKLVPFNFSITGTTKLGERYKELFQATPEWSDIKISLFEQVNQK